MVRKTRPEQTRCRRRSCQSCLLSRPKRPSRRPTHTQNIHLIVDEI
jgi:hypothetical protein